MRRLALLLLLAGCETTPVVPHRGPVSAFAAAGWESEGRSFQVCMQGVGVSEDSAGADDGFTGCRAHDYDFDGDVDLADFCYWATLDPDRTADTPDSWLVLYNTNNPDSATWAGWYAARWGIPPGNLFGLDVPGSEKVDVQTYVARIHAPIRNYLMGRPELNRRIMGIVVGFNVPGNFYMPSPHNILRRIPMLDGDGG